MNDDIKSIVYDNCKIANITFGIRAQDLSPDYISQILGIEASHSFSRGDYFNTSSGKKQRAFGVWQLRSENYLKSTNLEEHALFILNQLEAVHNKILTFLNNSEYYVDIRIWWETSDSGGGFVMSSDVVRRLSLLCNEINFTFLGHFEED